MVDSALTRAPGTALHRQLFVILRDRIARGTYLPGAALPSEDDLCVEFDVSRITVRRAVSDLTSLGLVEKHPGRGTFVALDVPAPRTVATLDLIGELRKVDADTKARVLSVGVETAPREIARQLDLLEAAKALRAVRLRSHKAKAVMFTESWVPERFASVVTAAALHDVPLYQLLMRHGVDFDRVVQEVTAVAADAALARHLEIESGAPLVKLTRLIYDTEAKPVQHLTVLFPPERSRLLMTFSIGSINTLDSGSIYHDS